MDTLKLVLNEKQLKPMDTLHGEVIWNMTKQPKKIEVRLFWYTQGRGSEDLRIVEKKLLKTSPQGLEKIEFSLPEGPYSFSGKLISLEWGVEVICDNKDLFASESIVVAPEGEEIILHPKASDGKGDETQG